MSRSTLSELIQRPSIDLFKKERQKRPMEDIIEMMTRATKFNLIESASRRGTSALEIQFSYTDRYKAQAVVRELVARLMEENASKQRSESMSTTDFLKDQLASAKATLDIRDAELTEFRSRNAGKLPEQFTANLQAMTSAQNQLQSHTEALNRIDQDRTILETQKQNLKNEVTRLKATVVEEQVIPGAPGSSGQVAAAPVNERLNQLNKQIADGETQLAAMREMYKDTFPEVKTVRAMLLALKKQRDDMLIKESEAQQERAAAAAASATQATGPRVIRRTNPAAAKAVEETNAQIANIEAQLHAKTMDYDARKDSMEKIGRRIAEYQSKIDTAPANEQKYAGLTRDYNLARGNYEELSKKKTASEMGSNIEERKAGEILELLDTASLPEQPTQPNRLVITAVGAMLGLVVGVSLAGAKEMKDTSLKNLKDIRAYTNMPVLSSIPLLENALLVRRKRRLFWLAWSTAIIVGTIAMSASMYYYFFLKTA